MRKAIILLIVLLGAACKREQKVHSTSESSPVIANEQPVQDESTSLVSESQPKNPNEHFVFEDSIMSVQFDRFMTQRSFPVAEETTSLATLAEQYVPAQSFLIDQRNYSVVTGAQGTKLSIPPSIFMINDSTPYQGSVRIELREIYDRSQMVFANYSTTSNGQPLETAGMIYWNATTEDGMPLQLDSGMSIKVEMTRKANSIGYQMFTGSWNDGMMNWSVMPSTLTAPTLSITELSLQVAIIPHDVFHYKQFRISKKIEGVDKNIRKEWNDQVDYLANGYFDGTRLCTKEFQRRMERIRWMGWNSELLAFYLDNPNDLQTADSLALIQVGEYATDIQHSSYSLSRKYFALGAGKKRWLRETTNAFRVFYEESKHYCDNIYLTSKEIRSRQLLTKRGVDPSYADWLFGNVVSKYNRTEHGYKIVDRPRTIVTKSYIYPQVSSFVTLNVPKMGYINCDRFIEETNKQNITVQIENYNDMDNVSATLIFRNLNSIMSGYSLNGAVTFNNVPAIYSSMWLVIGIKDGELYSASGQMLPSGQMQVANKERLMLTTTAEIEREIESFAG